MALCCVHLHEQQKIKQALYDQEKMLWLCVNEEGQCAPDFV